MEVAIAAIDYSRDDRMIALSELVYVTHQKSEGKSECSGVGL